MTLMTEIEMMEEIKVTRTTLHRWRKAGLPHFKLGGKKGLIRYDYDEVIQWMKQQNKSVRG